MQNHNSYYSDSEEEEEEEEEEKELEMTMPEFYEKLPMGALFEIN
jgi:hypothetical protein